GYSYSGYTKLISPSWQDGTAVARVLENPPARPGLLCDTLLTLPSGLLRLATWGALVAELSFAPLALIPWLRSWLWGLMVLMHLTLIVLVDFWKPSSNSDPPGGRNPRRKRAHPQRPPVSWFTATTQRQPQEVEDGPRGRVCPHSPSLSPGTPEHPSTGT